MGAYLMLVTPGVPLLGAFMFNGIYKMDAYRSRCTGVFTTKTPTDAYRGAGRPEATFGIERIMDELAAELAMDPLELRERNWITHEEFPYTTIAGLTYDSGNYEAATAKAMELFELRRAAGGAGRAARARRHGPAWHRHLHLHRDVRARAVAGARPLSYGAGGWEHASVRMLPTGKVEVVTGSTAHGQGHETAWSQIVADALGVPFEDMRVLHGDTQVSPKGMDTYGSRSLVVGGMAARPPATRCVAKAKVIAAHHARGRAGRPGVQRRGVLGKGDPDRARRSRRSRSPRSRRTTCPTGSSRRSTPMPPSTRRTSPSRTAPTCARPRWTPRPGGEDPLVRGGGRRRRVVNPLIVEGQVHGGIAQGIAQALYEEAVYDADGNLVDRLHGRLPAARRAADLPIFTTDRTETPSTTNPLGVKGVGEAGTIASTPAVVNAVVDALRPLGVRTCRCPAPRSGSGGRSRGRTNRPAPRRGRRSRIRRRRGMIPAKFDYVRPASLDDAVAALASPARTPR